MEQKRILGVLGGMGPAASAQFMMELAQKNHVRRDQEHPVVYLLSDPTIPDRGSAILGHGEDPMPQMRADIDKLVGWGAEVIAVPCNTAHYFIDRFHEEMDVAFVHIIDVTLEAAKKASPCGAWLVCTQATLHTGMYQRWAGKKRYRLHIPQEQAEKEIQDIIEEVKAGRMEEAGAAMKKVMEELWRVEDSPVILACTELPLAYMASGLPAERGISSITALAEASLEAIQY